MVNQNDEFIGNPIKPELVSDDDVHILSDEDVTFDVDVESEQEFEADIPLVVNGVFNFPIPDDYIIDDTDDDDDDDEDFHPEEGDSFFSGSDYDTDVYGFDDVDHATFSDSESNPETAFAAFPFNKDNSDNSLENKEDSEESDDANINASDATS